MARLGKRGAFDRPCQAYSRIVNDDIETAFLLADEFDGLGDGLFVSHIHAEHRDPGGGIRESATRSAVHAESASR